MGAGGVEGDVCAPRGEAGLESLNPATERANPATERAHDRPTGVGLLRVN
jgi:hypothetical protein